MVSLYEQSQTMTSSQHSTAIPFDHTEISLADIEDDSPVVRAAIANLQKRTSQLQKLSKSVLQSVAEVKEALDTLKFKEACLDASLADLATVFPAFGEAALPPLLARRRTLAISRKQEKVELCRILERPVKAISDQCQAALSVQRQYEQQGREYYSATHRWLSEGANASPALSSGSSSSHDVGRLGSPSLRSSHLPASHPEEQHFRELRFLLTRLDLYDHLLNLHGGDAEMSLVLPAEKNGKAPGESIAEPMSGLIAAEKDKVESRRSACQHRMAIVRDELRLSDAVIRGHAAGGYPFGDQSTPSKQAGPKLQTVANSRNALPSTPRRPSARFTPGSQELVNEDMRSIPPSPSSPNFIKPFSNALQRFKSGHATSNGSVEALASPLDASPYEAPSANADRESITSKRLSLSRSPSDAKNHWSPRRSISVRRGSNMIRETSSSSGGHLTSTPQECPSTPTSPSLVNDGVLQAPIIRSIEEHSKWHRASSQGLMSSRTPSPRYQLNVLSATHDAAWSPIPSSRPRPSLPAKLDESPSIPARKKEGTLWVMSKQVTSNFSSDAPRSANRSSLWSEAWVVLSGSGHLSEYTGWREKKAMMTPTQPMIDLQFATVRETRAVERKFVFEVVTRQGRRLYQAPTESGMHEWIKTIENAIESLYNGTSSIRQVDKVARLEGIALAENGVATRPPSFEGLIGNPRWSQNLTDLGVLAPKKLLNSGKEHRRLRGSEAWDDIADSTGSDIEVMAETSSSGISNKTPLSRYVASSRRELAVRPQLKRSANDDTAIDLRIEAAVHSSFEADSEQSSVPQSAPCSSSKRFSLDVPSADWHRQNSASSHSRTRSATAGCNDGSLSGSLSPSGRRALAQEIDCLSRLPVNSQCADCRTPNPRWASWSLCGSTCCVFVCITCAGMHRSLGVHLSKVKSVDLDDWTEEQVGNARQWNNVKANAIWEELREIGSSSEPRSATPALSARKGEKSLWNVKYVEQVWRVVPFGPLDP